MAFIRYQVGAEQWRAEEGEKLLSDFEMPMVAGREALGRWHLAFAGTEIWKMLRRLYGINPLLGGAEGESFQQPISLQEYASLEGLSLRAVESALEGAKTYWIRWQAQEELRTQRQNRQTAPPPQEVSVKEAEPMGEAEVDRLLLANGFVGIKDAQERVYIAGRIGELEPWLESEQSRAVARSLIQQEVMVFFVLDRAIAATREDMEEKKQKGHDAVKSGEQLLKLMKERRDSQAGIESTMKQLGMDEARNASLKKKISFKDTIGTLMDGVAAYYSDADTALIDGVYTAAEIELLVTPFTLRPAQYRPDVVVACWEAMQNFWDRDYVPTPASRLTLRRLRSGFAAGLAAIRSEEGESIADMGESGEELTATLADEAQAKAAPNVGYSAPSQAGPQHSSAPYRGGDELVP